MEKWHGERLIHRGSNPTREDWSPFDESGTGRLWVLSISEAKPPAYVDKELTRSQRVARATFGSPASFEAHWEDPTASDLQAGDVAIFVFTHWSGRRSLHSPARVVRRSTATRGKAASDVYTVARPRKVPAVSLRTFLATCTELGIDVPDAGEVEIKKPAMKKAVAGLWPTLLPTYSGS